MLPGLFALASCTGVVDDEGGPVANVPVSSGGSTAAAGAGGSGGTGNVTGSAASGGVTPGAGGDSTQLPPADCNQTAAVRAPIRRLIPFELNNTLKSLGLDAAGLALNLPAGELSNGFGNDADQQSQGYSLIAGINDLAGTIADSATAPGKLGTLLPCSVGVTVENELSCARSFVDSYGPKLFRRPLEAGEADAFVSLFQTVHAKSDFPSSISTVLGVMLQDPAFLYRPEFGVPAPEKPELMRPTGFEMATRLSFLLWGTAPDDALRALAASGALDSAEGVKAQTAAMLKDERAKAQVRFFFDNLLPIASLSQLERDKEKFPAYSAKLGAAMRQETEAFLDYQIFSGPGTWPSVFTADYTFVNETLAKFYGMTGITGEEFRKVPVDPKRSGLLGQAGIGAGVIHSNEKNPVTRGVFMMNKMLCQGVPPPPPALGVITNPVDDPTKTTREEFKDHSSNAACAACHANIDPLGFGFENFDAIGQWLDTEVGKPIDASGNSPLIGAFSGPAELGKRMAESEVAQKCFATHWLNYGYGKTVKPSGEDACTVETVQTKFKAAGYDVKQLLAALTESDAFIYLPKTTVTE